MAAVLVLLLLAACAHRPPTGGGPEPGAPAVDSVTSALWHFDEVNGNDVADAGPRRLDGIAGLDAPIDYGRFGRARSFGRSANAFIVVQPHPQLDLVPPFTLEAWIYPRSFAEAEFSTLLARMSHTGNQRSYVWGVTGSPGRRRSSDPLFGADAALGSAGPGRLWFAFVPAGAWSGLYSFFSVGTVEAGRWTHVAVSYDGETVRFHRDGRLDSRHAASGVPARVTAPLTIGIRLDPLRLSDFSGELRVESTQGLQPPFPFDGLLDEVRVSRAVRDSFPGAEGR